MQRFYETEAARMSKEDKIRFSFLLIVTIIVMAMNIQIVTTTNRRGLTMLDSMFESLRRKAGPPPRLKPCSDSHSASFL